MLPPSLAAEHELRRLPGACAQGAEWRPSLALLAEPGPHRKQKTCSLADSNSPLEHVPLRMECQEVMPTASRQRLGQNSPLLSKSR